MSIQPADQPAIQDQPWWHERVELINTLKNDRPVDLIFVGDSITQDWQANHEPWNRFYTRRNPLNMGIGGDMTQHILWRLQNGHLEGIRPRLAVVLAGTNNTGGNAYSAQDIAGGIKAICSLLIERIPTIKILLLGVFPRDPFPSPLRVKIAEINRLISAFDDGHQIHFLDIGSIFLEPDASISAATMQDFLHLEPHAYTRWAEAIEPKVQELFGA